MAELQSAWGAACVDAAGEATVYGDDASTEAGGPCLTAIVFLTRATECFGRAAELVGDAKGKASSEYAAATRRARASRRALADAMKLN
ncbi:uncharacterized protein MICPUCDRAFT_57805 [Micromonas pusilla CCMP1545]|jgi:hypothetical protein|uniref:Predicted protein n=1 Tax=Micromonas pusilla (strain CCMP1545) TaxID=564608 RepID=C1MSS5_MICPC|nr:uncharacterized protein MICPUCDRAFT_57805 [Micromonas pusilla CCMP1545]EEH56831.1 predicted protein [Micromonas pusilla CCMP1545]|tara:strand:- start:1553 stop:1816 length:264 start_codon:yes stop_codon:yes gene_type:complete|eukprot:XP_003058376.1 predicted protein [Micromonas pusilla CCMP1545]